MTFSHQFSLCFTVISLFLGTLSLVVNYIRRIGVLCALLSRDRYKSQYEQQLQAELRQMSASTQDEVEKLRSTTRAMYEMESRTLRESRDMALTDRDKAISQEAETQAKYQQLNELLVNLHVPINQPNKLLVNIHIPIQ